MPVEVHSVYHVSPSSKRVRAGAQAQKVVEIRPEMEEEEEVLDES